MNVPVVGTQQGQAVRHWGDSRRVKLMRMLPENTLSGTRYQVLWRLTDIS